MERIYPTPGEESCSGKRSPGLLLHTCCAPCAAPSVERLLSDGHRVILFFSNSNIYPIREYQRRLENVKKTADFFHVELIEDEYNHDAWLEEVRGLESEPERGRRCRACFSYSLGRSRMKADLLGAELFTTTLTLSPQKSSATIFEIGKQFEGFLEENFKKKDGFRRSIDLCRSLDLYRQTYCGCEFSLR